MKYFIALLLFVSVSAHADMLFIGDSISNEYTPFIQQVYPCAEHNHGKIHNPGNAHSTAHILANLDSWLYGKHYTLIHFNAGLWDIAHLSPSGKFDFAYPKNVAPEQYKYNLIKIVQRLEQTGATLVFATTTPIPNGTRGRNPSDVDAYNRIALKVMANHPQIIIDDLNTVMQGKDSLRIFPTSVHFGTIGAMIMAQHVEQVILPFAGC